MRTYLMFFIFFVVIKGQGQTPVMPLNTIFSEAPVGAYFKDTFGELDKYVGTWKFTNLTEELTIIIEKKTMVFDGTYYQDELIGEYKYIKDGTVIVNTIPLLELNYQNETNNIGGNLLIGRDILLPCQNCTSTEKRVKLYFSDPQMPYLTSTAIVLHHKMELTEPQQMTATIFATHGVMIPDENSPVQTRVPYGTYLMVKQD